MPKKWYFPFTKVYWIGTTKSSPFENFHHHGYERHHDERDVRN